ncbi:MAG: hypothetical protein IJI68_10935 [Eggerthellaceae bacterium]|nr:hypothetical protein [Eggerthellaceae bacterium]
MPVSGSGSKAGQSTKRIWIARVLVALVFAINVQCALQFILWPGAYTAAYQVEGASAEVIVRTVGICFLMWNATYPPVIVRPDRYRVLFGVVLVQQAIGLVGESLLLAGLQPGLEVLASSIARFVAFDAAGLVLLAIAFLLSRARKAPGTNS